MSKKNKSKKGGKNTIKTEESEELPEDSETIEVKSKLYKILSNHLDNFDSLNKEDNENNIVNKEDRYSFQRMTKYEAVRIIGERKKQLILGAKPLIKNTAGLSYDQIAIEELKNNMIPFKIKRPMPNGTYEIWNIKELKKEHLFYLLNE